MVSGFGPAARGRESPALRGELQESAVAVGEIDLGGGPEHFGAGDAAGGDVEVGRGVRAGLGLVVLERVDGSLRQLLAGALAVMGVDGAQESFGHGARDALVLCAAAASQQQRGSARDHEAPASINHADKRSCVRL